MQPRVLFRASAAERRGGRLFFFKTRSLLVYSNIRPARSQHTHALRLTSRWAAPSPLLLPGRAALVVTRRHCWTGQRTVDSGQWTAPSPARAALLGDAASAPPPWPSRPRHADADADADAECHGDERLPLIALARLTQPCLLPAAAPD